MTIETSVSSPKQTVKSIQALRAYAAITVLLAHSVEEWASFRHTVPAFETLPLTAGVDIFFVISGFIMYYTSSNAFGQPGGAMSFMIRRLIRIVPLYWLFTTLILLPGLLSPGAVRSAEFD